MKWSWRIGTIAGIGIYLHGTFLVLILFIVLSEWAQHRSLTAALAGVLFLLAIFGTIVLHELGHALTARRFGVRTRDIILLPIGGLARLERMPDLPRQELWVALAGPAVNIAIGAGIIVVVLFVRGSMPILSLDASGGVLGRFAAVNLWLAAFNLLPGFPMDGGRALRALIAERTDYVRATRIATSVGQGMAVVFGVLGLFVNPFLVFIALFVWMGASAETSMVTMRAALSGTPVSRAMVTDFRAVEAGRPLQHAVDLMLAGSQRAFPVVDDGRLVGLLTRDALLRALEEGGVITPIRDVMTRQFQIADAGERLEAAFVRLQSGDAPAMPVVSDGKLVGLLTADSIGEFVTIRSALRK